MDAGIAVNRLFNPLSKALGRARSLTFSKPDFYIAGTQKGGTTSLYEYLVSHPNVLPASKKEIRYFTDQFDRGNGWYRRHFPPMVEKYGYGARQRDGRCLTGEATPCYIFHPHVPARIRRFSPEARVIMMLRNPVDRAYSHYRYHVKLGAESLSFEAAIEAEPQRLKGELERMVRDERYCSLAHKMYSYLSRGRYVEQLQRWFAVFPRQQILVIKSEDFFTAPQAVFETVLEFLGLPHYTLSSYERFNAGNGNAAMSDVTRTDLIAYFRPHNERLYELLGTDMDWER